MSYAVQGDHRLKLKESGRLDRYPEHWKITEKDVDYEGEKYIQHSWSAWNCSQEPGKYILDIRFSATNSKDCV